MSLTIREALKFGGLFGATVVAGEEGLDIPIESVSVLEIADRNISHWVLKKQLYITAFYAICDNVEQQKVVIQTLIDYGGCGLVLCYVGTWVQQIDQEIIDLCNEAGFPLIQARQDVSYIEIMNPIQNLLYKENAPALEPNNETGIRNDFLNLIINEENMNVVFQQMNQRLEKRISYYDTYGKIIFSDRDDADIQKEEEYLKYNFNHVLYACSKKGYTVQSIEGKECLIVLIRSQKNLFGLFVTDYDETFSEEMEEKLIHPLVVSGSLILRRKNRMADLREKAVQEYAADLLVWNFPSNERAVERGYELGLTILDKNCIVLININSIQQMTSPKVQQEIQDYVKRVLLGKIEEFMKSYNTDNWLALRSDTIILFMDNRDSKIDMKKFCGRLLGLFQGKPNLSVSVGVSNSFTEVTKMPDAYFQAFEAAVIGREHYGENKVIFYDAVYFFQKLRKMGAQDETYEVCQRFIGPVASYDEEHGTELVDTLRILLENNGNTHTAASQMYVHKNTVLQRRNKIIELLGYSPFEMPHLLNFLIVFDILKGK